MAKIALILGSGVNPQRLLEGFEQRVIKTVYGNVLLYHKGKCVLLLRHGKSRIPPHRINHKAHMCALNVEGVEKVFSVSSVGSLTPKIKPGSFVLVEDYVNFSDETFFEMELKSITPEISLRLKKELQSAGKKAKIPFKKGVYVQTRGPRFETKAEIKILKSWGQVVGMTLGTEATLAREIGLPYAGVAVVDNLANGIGKESLSMAILEKNRKASQKKIEKLAKVLLSPKQR